jgi:hypothetical protein
MLFATILYSPASAVARSRPREVAAQGAPGEDYSVPMRFVPLICLLILLLAPPGALGDEPALKSYASKYYLLHTDLPQAEVREAQLRMTRMVEEYRLRTPGVGGRIKDRLPFYLYKNLADYTQAVGVEGSGGFFDGEKLMATTLRTPTGAISADTWHIVQHEGFHQFAHTVINGEIPMWADEGLAEYFGEAIFTGDGFVTGLIPQARLTRVRKLLKENARPLPQLLAMTRDQWNAKVEMRNYDQAWSFVHFLTHGEAGRLQKPLNDFMQDLSKGQDAEKSYQRHLGVIPNLEARYRGWWLKLSDHPTSQGYDCCTLAMLTSFLARAEARGQSFTSFDELIKTPAAKMSFANDEWLPTALFEAAVADAGQMQSTGGSFALVKSADGSVSIVLTEEDGTKLAGRWALKKDRRIDAVRVEMLPARSVQTRPATD